MVKYLKVIVKAIMFLLLMTVALLASAYGLITVYKKDVLAYLHTQLKESLNGKIKVEDLTFTIFHPFPQLTLTLKGVQVEDTVTHTQVLIAEKVFLQVHILKLLQNELEIGSAILKKANLNIYKNCDGYSNTIAFKRRNGVVTHSSNTEPTFAFKVHHLHFDDVVFNFRDDKKEKEYHLFLKDLKTKSKWDDGNLDYEVKGEVFTRGFLFNSVKGAFLTNKNVKLDLHLKHIAFDSTWSIATSKAEIEDITYGIAGKINYFERKPSIELYIDAPKADYKKGLSILSDHLKKVLSRFYVENGLSCEVKLILPLTKGIKPNAEVKFKLDNSRLLVLGQEFLETSLVGRFSNQEDTLRPIGDPNSAVEIISSTFKYYGVKGEVKGKLHDLEKCLLNVNASLNGNLTLIHPLLDTTKYKFNEGIFSGTIDFKGPLITKLPIQKIEGELNGQFFINNGSFSILDKRWSITKIKSTINFNNTDLVIPFFNCSINGNPLHLKTNMDGIVPYLLLPKKNMEADLLLTSSHFDLNTLFNKVESKKQKKRQFKPFMEHLELIAQKLAIKARVDFKDFSYKKLTAKEVKGILELNKKGIQLKDWNLKMLKGGVVQLKGDYAFNGSNEGTARCTTSLNNIDAQYLFYGFNNFGQKTLRHEHLEGKLNAEIAFRCRIDDNYNPLQETMDGKLSIQLDNGALKNFEPLAHLNRLVFKHRDLNHIRFDQINNDFVLKGEDIHIQKMTVSSSALILFLEGIYSFKDRTDLSIEIPLANLKGNKDGFYHLKHNDHTSIFLRAQDKDGKMSVSLDLFNKFHKKMVKDSLMGFSSKE